MYSSKKFLQKNLKNIAKNHKNTSDLQDIQNTYRTSQSLPPYLYRQNTSPTSSDDNVNKKATLQIPITLFNMEDIQYEKPSSQNEGWDYTESPDQTTFGNPNNTLHDQHTNSGFAPINVNTNNQQSNDSPNLTEPTPNNMEIDNQTSQTSNKGKSTEDNTQSQNPTADNDGIKILHNIFSTNNKETPTIHEAFIPRDSFKSELTRHDIIDIIKNAFITEHNAITFNFRSTATFQYIIIGFKLRDSLERYIKESPKQLRNIKIYELNKENINTLIDYKFQSQDNSVVKILDIPYDYDNKLIIKHLANTTGVGIVQYSEVKKPAKRFNNRKPDGKPIYIKPPYKQLIVHFQSQNGVEYIYKNDYWSLEIENFSIQILPGNPNHEEHKKRTSRYYQITGLPVNTTVHDLKPLIKQIKGKSCSFTSYNRASMTKKAYIYADLKDFDNSESSAAAVEFNNNYIYIYPSTAIKKSCNFCGNFKYDTKDCLQAEHITDRNGRKIYKRRIIERGTQKIALDENAKNNYNHIIHLNSQNLGTSTSQQRLNNAKQNNSRPTPQSNYHQLPQNKHNSTANQIAQQVHL
ncbi:hypothetical protein C1646_773145, partial [Rhizophagus diaphanus]